MAELTRIPVESTKIRHLENVIDTDMKTPLVVIQLSHIENMMTIIDDVHPFMPLIMNMSESHRYPSELVTGETIAWNEILGAHHQDASRL